MYAFLEQTFVPSLWQNNTDTNQAERMSQYLHPIDISNRMMGSARIRQVRVAATPSCQVDPMFVDYTIDCFPPFVAAGFVTSSNEATASFGPEGKYTHSG